MKKNLLLLALLCSIFTWSHVNAQQSYSFDFGDGEIAPAPGFIRISPDSLYKPHKGYGLHGGYRVEAVTSKAKGDFKRDYITSKLPFYFSVALPEGNYRVKLFLGDLAGVSTTTVRAECRRLFLLNSQTKNKKISELDFIVHLRDSLIRNEAGEVVGKIKLKPRESLYQHWDNLLTLEFSDTLPKIAALQITPERNVTTVFLAGNSTVVDQDKEPWAAWGQIIPSFFKPDKVVVANYAESGEALYSFNSAKRLEKITSLMKAGDYLFIEFGHNDQKRKGEGIGAFTSYKKDLKYFIAETRKKGGIPVLVTSMHRRNFDEAGKIVNTLGDYPEVVRQTAAEEKVALIDLNAMSKTLYEAWGPTESLKAFVHFPANSFPGQTNELKDNTHFSTYGAHEIARCIALGIQKAKLPLAKQLIKQYQKYDPAKPLPFSQWRWPLSPSIGSVTPDGN